MGILEPAAVQSRFQFTSYMLYHVVYFYVSPFLLDFPLEYLETAANRVPRQREDFKVVTYRSIFTFNVAFNMRFCLLAVLYPVLHLQSLLSSTIYTGWMTFMHCAICYLGSCLDSTNMFHPPLSQYLTNLPTSASSTGSALSNTGANVLAEMLSIV